jgi:lysophospholipase L1-like esterase
MPHSDGAHRGWVIAALVAACLATAGAASFVLGGRADGQGAPPPRQPVADERVVVLGDSVATGAGCDCRPFGPRLATLLASRLHRAVHVSTLAKDGQTAADLLSQLQSDAGTEQQLRTASAVTVTIGANDFDASGAVPSCADRGRETACYDSGLKVLKPLLGQLLGRLRSLTPSHTRLLVTGYWNVFLDGAVGASEGAAYERTSDALTRRVNDELRAAARDVGATYIDLYRAFRGTGTTDDTPLLAADGDHPSDAGQQRIAQVLAGGLSSAAAS